MQENLHLLAEELFDHVSEHRTRARLHTFSEVSELVLHDLTNPLSVIKFCTEKLKENPALLAEKPQYLEKIISNLDRSFSIIENFRSIVRQKENSNTSRIDFCHKAAIKLLTPHFQQLNKSLTTEIDPSLEGLSVQVPPFDLIFIFDSLFRDLLLNDDPQVNTTLSTRLEDRSNGKISIIVDANTSKSNIFSLGNDSLKMFNFQIIHHQLVTYGGHVEYLDKSLRHISGTRLRIVLPLVQISL